MTLTIPARLGLLCAAASVLAGVSAANAQEGVAIKNLLGSIGLIPPEKDPIQYRERAPLVLPPKMELREPSSRESFASSNPQWPNDPDVARKRNRNSAERVPVTESEIRRMSERNPGMSQEELRRGRTAAARQAGVHRSEKVDMDVQAMSAAPAPSDDKDEGPVVRKTLAEPPSLLRQSARGTRVDPTFGTRTDQQEADARPMNWLTRVFRKDDDE